MKIRSVAILGAGAVGSYLLWGLTDKPGVTVSVVAEGTRADRLRRAGCTINGKTYRPQVPDRRAGPRRRPAHRCAEIRCPARALDDIRAIVGENTTVMSLMNGVDSEEIIGAAVGDTHVLPAHIKVASHRTEDGVFFDPDTTIGIIYGESQPPFLTAPACRL